MAVRAHWKQRIQVCIAALLLFSGMGCATILNYDLVSDELDYFQRPEPADVWSPKIEGWQRRERFDSALLAPLESGPIPGCSEAIADRPTLAAFLDRMSGRIKSLEQPHT